MLNFYKKKTPTKKHIRSLTQMILSMRHFAKFYTVINYNHKTAKKI